MRHTIVTLSLTALISIISACSGSHAAGEFKDLYRDLPFEMGIVHRPEIPNRSVSVVEFGGNGNGTFLNTEAFAEAMAYLSSKGGGHLIIPAGIWRTGPIGILSNIDLHIDHEAVIVFDPDLSLYPIVNTVYEGLDTRRCESPIHAVGAHDISITGGGVIEGSGEAWRSVKKSKMTPSEWKALLATGGWLDETGGTWYPDSMFRVAQKTAGMFGVPDSSFDENEIKRFLRPVMVSLRECENVLLEDCLFQNSPAWNIHPLMCKNVIIKNITVRNPAYSQNGDGIDIDSCTDVVLVDSSFDCGDDGICIKSGKDEDGRRRARPCKGLIVDGCTVYHGHGGFVVGSEMSGGVQNISVNNCRFLGTDVGLRFKSTRGRGGVVEGIWVNNIYMKDIATEALLFDLFYGGKSAVESAGDKQDIGTPALPVDETTPAFRDIHISNVVCAGAKRAMYFNGLPEMPVKGVTISDCTISSKKGIELSWSEDVTLRGVNVTASMGEPLVTRNVSNLNIEE